MRRFRKTINRLKSNSDGFTLLEAMISLVVFSIGILGMAALQTTAVQNNTLAEDVQQNTVWAMAEIEELMATDFMDQRIPDAPGGATICNPSVDGKYTICSTCRDDANIPGAKRITVTARFTPPGGRTQAVTMSIIKPDVDNMGP